MARTVHRMYQAGLAPSTQRAYKAGKKRYLQFCGRVAISPLPVSETMLCRFLAFLRLEGLCHQTAKSYLSAVRHLQISQGLGDPRISSMPQLELVLPGMKRELAGQPAKPRLFRFKNGKPLTHSSFVAKLQETLEVAGVDCSGYSGHSLSIGATTTAASKGIQDSLIKTMGRWQRVAYQLYVRTPQAQLISVAHTLAGSSEQSGL